VAKARIVIEERRESAGITLETSVSSTTSEEERGWLYSDCTNHHASMHVFVYSTIFCQS
jgi:hypothetical protein